MGRSVDLRYCTVEQDEGGTVLTTFRDGSRCPATPHDTHHYHVIANRLGYGDDTDAYCFEHEVCHCLVEQEFHDRPSRVLWALAHGGMLSGKEAIYEEMAAQQLQRWLRTNEQPIVSGCDWVALKVKALNLLETAPCA